MASILLLYQKSLFVQLIKCYTLFCKGLAPPNEVFIAALLSYQ